MCIKVFESQNMLCYYNKWTGNSARSPVQNTNHQPAYETDACHRARCRGKYGSGLWHRAASSGKFRRLSPQSTAAANERARRHRPERRNGAQEHAPGRRHRDRRDLFRTLEGWQPCAVSWQDQRRQDRPRDAQERNGYRQEG